MCMGHTQSVYRGLRQWCYRCAAIVTTGRQSGASIAVRHRELGVEPVEVVVYEDVVGAHKRAHLWLDAADVRLLDWARFARALGVHSDVVFAFASFGR